MSAAAAEPSPSPPLGAASLAAAIALGDCDALLKILDSGVPLAAIDDPSRGFGGHGALHLVADHPEAHPVLPLLLEKGARLDVVDAAGDSPLHRFVRGRMHQAVAALLAHGCDADARNPRTGDTPLHVAARAEDEDMVALLVSLGDADETVENNEGVQPSDIFQLPER